VLLNPERIVAWETTPPGIGTPFAVKVKYVAVGPAASPYIFTISHGSGALQLSGEVAAGVPVGSP